MQGVALVALNVLNAGYQNYLYSRPYSSDLGNLTLPWQLNAKDFEPTCTLLSHQKQWLRPTCILALGLLLGLRVQEMMYIGISGW